MGNSLIFISQIILFFAYFYFLRQASKLKTKVDELESEKEHLTWQLKQSQAVADRREKIIQQMHNKS